MKKLLNAFTEFGTWLCLCFTGSMLIYTACQALFGGGAIECASVFQVFGLSAGVTLLQWLCFSGAVFKKLRYSLRMLIFSVPLLGLLALCAVAFRWFPVERPEVWAGFLLIALAAFVGISIGFEIYFWAAGKKYDGLLGQYKSRTPKKREP